MALTVGADSYISVTDADSYFSSRLNSDAWTNSDTPTKETALKQATNRIDMQKIVGEKLDDTQDLEFPRDFQDSVPDEVEKAVCEEALVLLEENYKAKKKQRQGIESEKIGDSSRKYNSDVLKSRRSAQGLISPEAKRLIGKYIQSSVRLG